MNGTETQTSYNLCSDSTITCPTSAIERTLQQTIKTSNGNVIAADSIIYTDILGREIRSETQAAWGTAVYVDTEYDSFGRVKKSSHPYKATDNSIDWIDSEYDVLGRTTKTTEANNAVTSTAYNGLSVSVTTPLLETEIHKVNARGELVRVTDAMSGTIDYTYTPFGSLTSTTDSQGNTVTIVPTIGSGYDL